MFHPIKHFCTITRHRHIVMAYCFKAGIGWQGLFHDLSKYSPAEFISGAKYYQGDKSPNVEERHIFGYSAAWLHHQGRNKHHFEYWFDYIPDKVGRQPIQMPRKYVVEMFCDRVAACRVYLKENYDNTSPLSYFSNHMESYTMHPETIRELESLLKLLNDSGERETFKYIREVFLRNKE